MLDTARQVAALTRVSGRGVRGLSIAFYRVKLKDPHSILAHPSRGGAAKPGASKGEMPDEVVRLPKVSRAAGRPDRQIAPARARTSKASR